MEKQSLETPALLVDETVLHKNIDNMQQLSQRMSVRLRPMVKTHKSPVIAWIQIRAGAVGVMTATLREALVFAQHGIPDITLAYPVLDPLKIQRLNLLARQVLLTVTVDSEAAVEALSKNIDPEASLKVLIKINSGLNRLGVKPEDSRTLLKVAEKISKIEKLVFEGVATHAGQVYACSNHTEVEKVAEQEKEAVLAAKRILEPNFRVSTAAIGTTPTVKRISDMEGVNEIRPGNYVFNDNIQVALGSAVVEQCALTVLSTVLSRPENGRAVIDAGSKALGLDRGAHSATLVNSFGRVVGHETLKIVVLSEELGTIEINGDQELNPGQKIEIIPNHACAVANLFREIFLIKDNFVVGKIDTEAR